MKKLLFLFAFSLSWILVFSQNDQRLPAYGYEADRFRVINSLQIPHFTNPSVGRKDSLRAQIGYKIGDTSALWLFSPETKNWYKLSAGGGGTGSVDSVTARNDSLFYHSAGSEFFITQLQNLDTTSLSDRIDTKQDISDTSSLDATRYWVTMQDFNKPKLDSVTYFRFNTAATTLANGWKNVAPYSTYITETPVSDGLQIASTLTSWNYNGSVPRDSLHESAYNDVSISMTIKVTTIGGTLPRIGTVMLGATDLYQNRGDFYIDLGGATPGAVAFATTHFGNFSVGTLSNIPSAGDVVKITHRRFFDRDTLFFFNQTDNTLQIFSHNYGGAQTGCATTNIIPGFLITDLTVILKEYVFFATTGARPDILILGASLQQNQMSAPSYDSTFVGRLNENTAKKVIIATQCANNISDFNSIIWEVKKLKPKTVVLGDLGYNEIYAMSQPSATWQPNYKKFVDSMIVTGARVVIPTIINNPANAIPDTLNRFIDSVFMNNPKVQVFNITRTEPVYNESYAHNADPTFFQADGIHWNEKTSKPVADAYARQLEKMERFNLSGATDIDWQRKDSSLLVYVDTALNAGYWKVVRLGAQVAISGDSIGLAGGLITGGTTSYVPRYTSATSLGKGTIYDNNTGNVFIDDITNSTNFTNTYRFLVRSGFPGATIDPQIMFNSTATGIAQYNILKLSVDGASTGSTITQSLGRNHATRNLYYQSFGYVGNGSTGNYLEQQFYGVTNLTRLYASGNFTIGSSITSDPGVKFSVAGRSNFTDTMFYNAPTAANMTGRSALVWNNALNAIEKISKDSLGGTGGAGTVTDYIFTDGNGFDGTVTNTTTTPTLSLTTTVSDTRVIYSSSGSLAGAAGFTFNSGTNALTVSGSLITPKISSSSAGLAFDASGGGGDPDFNIDAGNLMIGIRSGFSLVWGNLGVLAPDAGITRTGAAALKATNGSTGYGNFAVLDDPFDATGWNGNNDVPTKNAIRDKIESIGLNRFGAEDIRSTTARYFSGAGSADFTKDSLASYTVKSLGDVGGYNFKADINLAPNIGGNFSTTADYGDHVRSGYAGADVSTGVASIKTFAGEDTVSQVQTLIDKVRLSHTFGKYEISALPMAANMTGRFVMVWDSTNDRWERIAKDSVGGASSARVYSLLLSHYTDAGNVGTGEDDLMSYSIPGGTMSADGDILEFTMTFTFAANANNKQIKLYYGGTQVYASGAQAQNAGTMELVGRVIRTGATSQRISVSVRSNTTNFPDVAEYVTAAETLSGAVTIKATGEATSNDDIVQKILTAEIKPKN